MASLRLIGVGLALLAATAFAVGSAGFTDVSAARGIEVAVVGNDEAYVGVQACYAQSPTGRETSGAESATFVRVRVTNRYVDAIHVVSIASDAAAVNGGNHQDGDATVGVGDAAVFQRSFDGAVSTVTVGVAGDGLSASVTRTVTPRADCPFGPGAGTGAGTGNGAGTATGTSTTDGTTTDATGTPNSGVSTDEPAGAGAGTATATPAADA